MSSFNSKEWNYPTKIIAHRGGGKFAPENTIFAINVGKTHGYKAVEFDVMLSQDKVPVLVHDEFLDRTVFGDTSHRGKCVSEVDCVDLLQLDVGSWFDPLDPSLSSIRMPLFEDVIRHCMENDIHMNIEIKPAPGFDIETAEVVAALTSKYFPSADCPLLPLFSSFSFDSVMAAKNIAPHIPRAYLIESFSHAPQWREQLAQAEVVAMHINHIALLNDDAVVEVHNMGMKVFCYTVNSAERARELLAMGVDAFCTDELKLFQEFAL